MDVLKSGLNIGAFIMICLGIIHAASVAFNAQMAAYWWMLSLFLIVQGSATLLYVNRRRRRSYRSYAG